MSIKSWIWRLACAALAVWGLLVVFPACNTPFIPLPPPGNPTFTPVEIPEPMGGTRTVWEARGGPSNVMGEAKVLVFNVNGGSGVIVRAQPDGSYVAGQLEGVEGDRIQISYETKDRRPGPVICRPLVRGESTADCP
jgi:hypothetical protein